MSQTTLNKKTPPYVNFQQKGVSGISISIGSTLFVNITIHNAPIYVKFTVYLVMLLKVNFEHASKPKI